MFNKQTVIIVGAGASAEYQLPVGTELAEKIKIMMDIRYERGYHPASGASGDFELYESLKPAVGREKIPELQQAFFRIRDGILLSNSIDDFLDRHEGDELMRLAGKAAIAKAILSAEAKSSMKSIDNRGNFNIAHIGGTWLLRLFRMMNTSCPPERLFENVSFITFNYDRTIERFLWQAVRDLYTVPEAKMLELIAPLKVFHPYGSIGPLPTFDGKDHVPYGGPGEGFSLRYSELANQIYTYTEQVRDKATTQAMHSLIRDAEQLVFLGFGFHNQNMQLLNAHMGRKQIFATAFGQSGPNQVEIKNRLLTLFSEPARPYSESLVTLQALSAAEMLEEFRMGLTN